jgi:hypothetical protein
MKIIPDDFAKALQTPFREMVNSGSLWYKAPTSYFFGQAVSAQKHKARKTPGGQSRARERDSRKMPGRKMNAIYR